MIEHAEETGNMFICQLQILPEIQSEVIVSHLLQLFSILGSKYWCFLCPCWNFILPQFHLLSADLLCGSRIRRAEQSR